MLHAVYRVGDMATTIDYYKKHFGMKLLRYRDIPDVRACRSSLDPAYICIEEALTSKSSVTCSSPTVAVLRPVQVGELDM